MTTVTPRSIVRAAGATVWLFITRVFVEPVREGRLRDTGWPAGLRPIVVVGLAGYIIAVTLVLASGLLRQQLDLFVAAGSGTPPVPREILWVVMALTAIALSLGQAGALHVSPWARWLVTTFTVLVLLLTAVPDLSAFALARVWAVIASIGLIVFVALRGRRAFAWWEFVAIALLVSITFAVSITVVASSSLSYGFDFVPIMVSLVLLTIGQLAVPAAIAAGAAVAELAVSSAVWAAGVVRDRLGRVAVVVVLVIVVIWRTIDLIPAVEAFVAEPLVELQRSVAAAVFVAAIAAGWVALRRVRATSDDPVTTAGLITTLSSVSLLIAACLTLIIPSALLNLGGLVAVSFGAEWLRDATSVLSSITSSSLLVGVTRSVVGLGLIGLAFLLARRGRALLPELLLAIGLSNATVGIGNVMGITLLWTPESLALVATLASLALLVWILVTRRVTLARLTGVTGALLVAALFSHREFLSDPLAVIIGSAAVATVLLGFVWSLLTSYSAANETSHKYPQASRVLLVLGNAVFATTMLAYTSLARDPDSVVNLALFTENGAQSFGDALIASSLIVAFTATIRDDKLV